MRLIDPIALKMSLAMSAILRDGKSLEEIIDEQPTIDPTKHGHWIGDYFPYKCSECGKMNDSKDNFCWNCGSDMREEK